MSKPLVSCIEAKFRWEDLGKIIENHLRYSICEKEGTLNIYRTCSEPLFGSHCYVDLKKNQEYLIYKDRKYLLCPRKKLYYPPKK